MQTHGLRGAVISDRYKVNGRIGGGSFGEIYSCTDLADSTEVRYLGTIQNSVKSHLKSTTDENFSVSPTRHHVSMNDKRMKQRPIVWSSLTSWQPLPSRQYAAKFEKVGHGSAQLRHEFKVYRELKGSVGICTVSIPFLTKIIDQRLYWRDLIITLATFENQAQYFGDHLKFRVLVIQLMGPSIEDVFEKCHMKFSLKTG